MEGVSSNGAGPGSRAERFDDEKRRIIDSVFGKKDKDGQPLESYITHIRITEDANFPSSPPPPDSALDAKKPRVIIVAVRKSGRVLMHKARENANGSFSIGKTWPLDDLSAVESFTGATPTTQEEAQRRQWAAGIGFIVTIGKPYYWQASTEKEKQFFVASLVKIYTKYTGGKTPQLIGFDERERNQLAASGRPLASRAPPPPLQGSAPLTEAPTTINQNQVRPEVRQRLRQQPSRDNVIPNGQIQDEERTTPHNPRYQPNETESLAQSHDNRQRTLNDARRPAGLNASQESFARADEYSLPPRSRGAPSSMASGRSQDMPATILPPQAINQTRANAYEPIPIDVSIKDLAGSDPIPERERSTPVQTMGEPPGRGRASEDRSLVPAPLRSPPSRNGELQQAEPQTPVSGRPSIDQKLSEALPYQSPAKFPARDLQPIDTSVVPISPPDSQGSPLPILSPPTLSPSTPVEERPGLGPMIKKKQSRGDVANSFRRVAAAAGAFKPRAGGAAERLRELGLKSSDGPDGITGVVPAPSLLRMASAESTVASVSAVPAGTTMVSSNLSKETKPEDAATSTIPDVQITRPLSEGPPKSESMVETSDEVVLVLDKQINDEKLEIRDVRRKKPASERVQQELATLGIDSSFLEGRGMEFITILDEFGWVGDGVCSRNIDDMKLDIERELDKAQAGGWLNRLEEEDEKIAAISVGIDTVVTECEELDGLLTLYSVELGTLYDDVAYIEAQSQGLQVQAANQKLLQAEIQSLLDIISISPDQLQCLKEASPGSIKGLEQIEGALVMLYKAIVTIDPSLRLTNIRSRDDTISIRSVGGLGDSEIGKMQVVQEKRNIYKEESLFFLRRLRNHFEIQFSVAFAATKDAMLQDGALKRSGHLKGKIDIKHHDLAWKALWRYSPILLFAREVGHKEWEKILVKYEEASKSVTQEEFSNAINGWRKTYRKPASDDMDFIFVNEREEKKEQSMATGLGRKLTVKAPQLNRLRSMADMGGKDKERVKDTGVKASEVFATALEETSAIIFMEQNFITDLFHITSVESGDFPDVVYTAPPQLRQGSDLRRSRPLDPNREMLKKTAESMEAIYDFWPAQMQNLILWTTEFDPTQGVGVLVALERKLSDLEETNQEFLTKILQRLKDDLLKKFKSFLGDQLRCIEDTKVKIKKRKGVINFIRVFPHFSYNLESMLIAADDLEIRELVNAAYVRIIKTMFDSLKVIARDNPSASSQGASLADPEAKEALNYQILLIENFSHYVNEVETKDNPVLEDWKAKARAELAEHLELYIGAVIRRPLGKLLDMLESTEARIINLSGNTPASTIANNPSHSKAKFKAILANYDAREIRNGIELLKGRVLKHFTHSDEKADGSGNKKLIDEVLDACVAAYANVERRVVVVSRDVYEGDAQPEWVFDDVKVAFRAR